MNDESLTLLLKIIGFAGLIAVVYYYFRRRKPQDPRPNLEIEKKFEELRTQGVPEDMARKQANTEYQFAMKARQKKVSIIMGSIWIAFGVFFAVINPIDFSSIALIGLGAIQVVTGLLIKTDKL
jgi:hypothetical protein